MATANRTSPSDISNEPLNTDLLKRIGQAVFGSSFSSQTGLTTFRQYFDYYAAQICEIKFEAGCWTLKPAWTEKAAVLASHDAILELMKLLRQHKENDKRTIKGRLVRLKLQQPARTQGIQQLPNTQAALDWAINTTLRLTYLVNVRDESIRNIGANRPRLEWLDDQTLQEFLSSYFPGPLWPLEPRESRPDPHFTIPFMVDVCGLRLGWTHSLEDHLRLDRRPPKLWIFPHKRFMHSLLKNEEFHGYSDCGGLPKAVLTEAVQTLLLLFPPSDKTRQLLESHGQVFDMQPPVELDRPLGLGAFHFWRDRLLELRQEVYDGPPISRRQLWRDARNPQQYYTFWLAAIIFVLTIVSLAISVVSMITGAVSMKASIVTTWGPMQTVVCLSSHASPRHPDAQAMQ